MQYPCLVCNKIVGPRWRYDHILNEHGLTKEDYCWKYVLNLPERPRCKHPDCNNFTKLGNERVLSAGFSDYCSCKCSANSPQGKKRRSETMTKIHSDPANKKLWSERMRVRSTEWHTQEWYRKEVAIKAGFGLKGRYLSLKAGDLYYRSTWERDTYIILDSMPEVIDYQIEPFYIPYPLPDGQVKNYYPDIIVLFDDAELEIIEVKPSNKLEDEVVKAKFEAAEKYCAANNIRSFNVWTEERIYGKRKE